MPFRAQNKNDLKTAKMANPIASWIVRLATVATRLLPCRLSLTTRSALACLQAPPISKTGKRKDFSTSLVMSILGDQMPEMVICACQDCPVCRQELIPAVEGRVSQPRRVPYFNVDRSQGCRVGGFVRTTPIASCSTCNKWRQIHGCGIGCFLLPTAWLGVCPLCPLDLVQ